MASLITITRSNTMARGRMTRRPRVRSLNRNARRKAAEAADTVAEKVEPEQESAKKKSAQAKSGSTRGKS
jgi:hypothetical protein